MRQEYKQVNDDANKRMCEAYHMSVVYNLRADQLTKWKRRLDFVSLGVAPGIALLIVDKFIVDKPIIRDVGLTIAGLCSTAAYLWLIFASAYKWERQLELSREVGSEARQLSEQLKHKWAELRDAGEDEARLQPLVTAVQRLFDQYSRLVTEIDKAGIETKKWMTLLAQQETMMNLGSVCASCDGHWNSKTMVAFTEQQAKAFCRESYHPNNCVDCGMPRTPAAAGHAGGS
jgi:hypothetical protein